MNCDRQVFSIAAPLNIHNGYYARNTGGSQVHLPPLLQKYFSKHPKVFRTFLCRHILTFIAFLFQKASQYQKESYNMRLECMIPAVGWCVWCIHYLLRCQRYSEYIRHICPADAPIKKKGFVLILLLLHSNP